MPSAKIVRILAQPRLIASGAAEALRMAGGGDRAAYYFSGEHWKAGVAELPRFRAEVRFGPEGWTGGVVPTTGTLRWAPAKAADYDSFSTAYLWKDAAITVELGAEGNDGSAPAAWETELVGTIADVSAEEGFLRFEIADLSAKLDKPLIAARFAGTGGLEGPAEAATRLKRRSWGRVFNVEGRILDKANSIYEFGDPAFPLQAISTLRDMGRAAAPAPTILAWQGSIAATFAALQAAAAAQGSGVVAPSIACAKWWTQPVGPLTADILGEIGAGYVETAPSIAERIMGVAGLALGAGELAAANAIRPDPAGLHIGDEMTTAQALDRLLLGVSLPWALDPTGFVVLRPFSFAGPVETLVSEEVTRLKVFPPVKSRRLGYQRNERQHNDGEIAAVLLAGEIEGLGDLATEDELHFGSPLLKEAAGGVVASLSNFKTALGTALGINLQGTLATRNDVYFGGGALLIREAIGGVEASLANFKTILGTALGIQFQGALATANAADWASQIIGTGKPSDNAGTTVELIDVGGGDYQFVGNTAIRVTGPDYDSCFSSPLYFPGACFASCRIEHATQRAFFGFKNTGVVIDKVDAYTQMDWGLYFATGGTLRVGASTGVVADQGYSHGSLGVVTYNGKYYQLFIDGVEVTVGGVPYRLASAGGHIARLFGSSHSQRALSNIYFGPFQQAAQVGINTYAPGAAGALLGSSDLITNLGTSLGIQGQGGLATANSVYFAAAGTVLESNGGPFATLAAFKTALGNALGISGQGTFATASSIAAGNAAEGAKFGSIRAYAGTGYNPWNEGHTPIIWNFQGGLDGWVHGGTANANAHNTDYSLLLATSTGATARIQKTSGISFAGGTYQVIRIRLLCLTPGTPWVGLCYYATAGHAFSGSYYKWVPEPPGWKQGEWCEVELHMSALTAGGSDWNASTITQLRFDLPGAACSYYIKYIVVSDSFGNYVTMKGALPAWDSRLIDAGYLYAALAAGLKKSNTVAITAADVGSNCTASIPAHSQIIPGAAGNKTVSYSANTVPGLAFSTRYFIYCDDPALLGGAVAYAATTSPAVLAVAGRVVVGEVTTPANGGAATGGSGGGQPPTGGGEYPSY